MMIRWDECYELCTQNLDKAAEIKRTATEGLEQFGPGAVLIQAKAKLQPKAQPKGFGAKKSSPSQADTTEGDLEIVDCSLLYIPLLLLQSGECSAQSAQSTVRVATSGELVALLSSGGVDPTRLLRLCGHESASVEGYPEADEPYDPTAGELVLMLEMELGGTRAYGADVAFARGGVLLTKGLDDVEELYASKGY
uniref:Uncharacterized protein n=1 Tax=Pyramimonas obovata TaxID=1411642 RepID=A0A7S0N0I3_9CHLO|mmetsp:Transcript_16833/g.36619  ORF Transcript_16833/g.36619 Transcript_16833/m.36619 type:complete len:195 (+) Transcript_16833:3-587(+)